MGEQQTLDLRQYNRIGHKEPVRYQFGGMGDFDGCVAQDLSAGGVRIRVKEFIPLNTELALTVHLADERVVECFARVVWIQKVRFGEDYYAGLEFSEDSSYMENQKQIYGFLSHQ